MWHLRLETLGERDRGGLYGRSKSGDLQLTFAPKLIIIIKIGGCPKNESIIYYKNISYFQKYYL